MTETTDKGYALSNAAAVVGSGLLALVGALIFLKTTDPAFAFHGVLFALGGILAAIAVMANWNKSFAGDNGYMDGPIRDGVIAAVFWGVVGLPRRRRHRLAAGLSRSQFRPPWTNFGRLRPLHTSAVIFAFGGNVLIATSFYVVQRTCRARLFGGSWRLVRLLGLPALHRAWPPPATCSASPRAGSMPSPSGTSDIWLTIVWVAYLLVFLGTLAQRKEPHIYVANWFYLAFIVTIAMLHVVNNSGGAGLVPRLEELFVCSPACRMR